MRQIKIVAIKDGTIEENLRALGYSYRICTNLRKKMGLIKVNSKDVKIVDKILKDQVFEIKIEDKENKVEKYDFKLDIVYEDEDLAIINKPAGLAVINTREHYGKSLQNALANIWGDFIYRPVNRLDKDTSGLMIVAKNQIAHSRLNVKHIKRKYLALCDGILDGSGEINLPIGRKDESIIERCIKNDGKEAITQYKAIKQYKDYTLVELTLLTGRTHQIRVHLKSIGHPLLGDSLYNPKYNGPIILENGFNLDRQALHSYYLEFTHPILNMVMKFENMPNFI